MAMALALALAFPAGPGGTGGTHFDPGFLAPDQDQALPIIIPRIHACVSSLNCAYKTPPLPNPET
jgi:hypothetical protein